MAEFKHDDNLWAEACLDTPFRGKKHAEARTAHEAGMLPGNAVKSLELGGSDSLIPGMPKHNGILVAYGDTCIVRGHGSPVSPKFVWAGTNVEYHRTWIVD